MAGLRISEVTKSLGSVDVLKGIDLAIEDGGFACFLGPCACGKSALLRSIAGLETRTAGQIHRGPRVTKPAALHERLGVAMICDQQDPSGMRPGEAAA